MYVFHPKKNANKTHWVKSKNNLKPLKKKNLNKNPLNLKLS